MNISGLTSRLYKNGTITSLCHRNLVLIGDLLVIFAPFRYPMELKTNQALSSSSSGVI